LEVKGITAADSHEKYPRGCALDKQPFIFQHITPHPKFPAPIALSVQINLLSLSSLLINCPWKNYSFKYLRWLMAERALWCLLGICLLSEICITTKGPAPTYRRMCCGRPRRLFRFCIAFLCCPICFSGLCRVPVLQRVSSYWC